MDPAEHIRHMVAQGHSTSAAVRNLAHIIRTTERNAWRIHSGEQNPHATAPLLLDIWHRHPAARPCWPEPTTDPTTPNQPTQQQ